MAEFFEGVKLRIGRQDYIVPALSMRQLKQYEKTIAQTQKSLGAAMSPADIDKFVEVIHAAVSRNYPDVTLDQMLDAIDLRSLPTLFPAVMGISGLEAKQQGEAQAQAEGAA